MAEIEVKCGICGVMIMEIEKPVITNEDRQMCLAMCACNEHGQADIQIIDVNEEEEPEEPS